MTVLSGIAKKLVDKGLLEERPAQSITEQAAHKKLSFVRMATFQKTLPAALMARIASEEFDILT